MKTLSVAASLMLAVLFGSSLPVIAADPLPGNIRVLKVKGDVTSVDTSTKKAEPLKEGAFLKQDHSVKTGAASTAVLLFSNGTTVSVSPNSVFTVDTFLQAPFDSTGVNFREIKEEPSISNTKVSLTEGRVLAVVAKLAKGSTLDIGTPSGVAGIRGTTLSVTTAGVAVVAGSVQVTSSNGNTSEVNGGEQTTFNAVAEGADPAPIPAGEQQQLQGEAGQVKQALESSAPETGAFEGAPEGSPEIPGTTGDEAGGFGGDQGAGSVGTAPTGGTGGGSGGGGGTGTTPSPNNGASNPAP